MSDDLMLDVGQANELKLAFRRADYSNDDIKRLCEGNILADVRRVLLGHATINVEYVIDCDARPFVPAGWSVKEHQKGGAYKWDKSAQKDALFYPSNGQSCKKFRKELRDMSTPVLNANVLDYLLANQHLIPEEWKGKNVFFWGTVYRSSRGDLYVRYLCWSGAWWRWSCRWLVSHWRGYDPAALRVS